MAMSAHIGHSVSPLVRMTDGLCMCGRWLLAKKKQPIVRGAVTAAPQLAN